MTSAYYRLKGRVRSFLLLPNGILCSDGIVRRIPFHGRMLLHLSLWAGRLAEKTGEEP